MQYTLKWKHRVTEQIQTSKQFLIYVYDFQTEQFELYIKIDEKPSIKLVTLLSVYNSCDAFALKIQQKTSQFFGNGQKKNWKRWCDKIIQQNFHQSIFVGRKTPFFLTRSRTLTLSNILTTPKFSKEFQFSNSQVNENFVVTSFFLDSLSMWPSSIFERKKNIISLKLCFAIWVWPKSQNGQWRN